jgi:hypothetical protein
VARNAISDFLSDANFWLVDVAHIEALAAPVFLPIAGFHSISMPELTADVHDIRPALGFFHAKVVKGGDVGNITLTRGARFFDSDFWNWIMTALTGNTATPAANFRTGPRGAGSIGGPSPRRDLLLVHFFRNFPLPLGPLPTEAARVAASVTAGAATAGLAGVFAGAKGALFAAGAFVDGIPKLPARAWYLGGCVPVRYKPGSDFDATSGQVSMMELEIAIETLEEIGLAAPPT